MGSKSSICLMVNAIRDLALLGADCSCGKTIEYIESAANTWDHKN